MKTTLQEITTSSAGLPTQQNFRLKINLAGKFLKGHAIDGKFVATKNSYQSPTQATGIPTTGHYHRNVYIQQFDQAVLARHLDKVKVIEERIKKFEIPDDNQSDVEDSSDSSCDLGELKTANSNHTSADLPSLLRMLKKKLREVNEKIEDILTSNRFSHKHLAMIHSTLVELELPIRLVTVSGQFIDDEEVIAFSKLLNEDILHLKLTATNISSNGAIALFDILAKNTTLRSLTLEGNHLDNAAMVAFASCLGKNSTLKAVSFANNPLITSACVPALLEALKRNKSFCQIKLEGTGLTAEDKQLLTEQVSKNAPKKADPSNDTPKRQYLSNWFRRKATDGPTEKTGLIQEAKEGVQMVSLNTAPADETFSI